MPNDPPEESRSTPGPEPVFIHSLFRTGSTWLWQKFREDPGIHAYYEPLHHVLLHLTSKQGEGFVYDEDATGRMHHPALSRPHFDEYGSLLGDTAPGPPFFRKSFCYDEHCENGPNPALKAYIDSLIRNAAPARPLLQFNRTALRCRWFRETYPGALALYLLRNPRNQWQSFMSMKEREGIDVFLTLDLLVASINRRKSPFRRLTAELPLYAFHSPRIGEEEAFYSLMLSHYSREDSYLLFFFHWLAAFTAGRLHTDMVVDMDRLPLDSAYRSSLTALLAARGVAGLSFDDARPRVYEDYSLPAATMRSVEKKAFALYCRDDEARPDLAREYLAVAFGDASHLADPGGEALAAADPADGREVILEKAEMALADFFSRSRPASTTGPWQKSRGLRALLSKLLSRRRP